MSPVLACRPRSVAVTTLGSAALLAALDRSSLERKRPLTLPLLREVLQTTETQTA